MKHRPPHVRHGIWRSVTPACIGAGLALVVICALQLSSRGQGPPAAPLRHVRLHMVFSSSLFPAGNRNDAMAAVGVWTSMFGRTRGFQVNSTIDVVDGVEEARKLVLGGSANVLALDVVEYLRLADVGEIEPVFCALRGDATVPPRYIMLVGAQSGIVALEDLRGKSVKFLANTNASLGQVWIDALLYDHHLGHPSQFFHSVDIVPKASGAILPVFFGKANAAVVDEDSFNVARELNPQVGARLRVLCASPPLPEGIFCICRKRIEYCDEFLQSVQELQLDPQGKQILMVFRFSGLAPVDAPAFAPVRELWRKHAQLARLPDRDFTRTSLPIDHTPTRAGGEP